jgi:hypothetical protein
VDRGREERREASCAEGGAIVDRMLYVADITRLRTFDADNGKPEGDYPAAPLRTT